MPAMNEAAQVGKRQEIADQIFNIEADATPMLSSLKTGKMPNQMLATWVGEVFPDVASTGVLDGTAATTPTRVDRYLLQGAAQHFRREWGVSTLAQLTNTAGVNRDEAGHQAMLALLLLKRMIEQQLGSADDAAVENGSTPWTSRGVFSWLSASAQTNLAVPASLRPAAGCNLTTAMASVTENILRGAFEAAFAAKRSYLNLRGFVGYDLRAAIDDLTNVYPAASTSSQPRTIYRVERNDSFELSVDKIRFSVGEASLITTTFLGVDTSTGAASAYTPKSGVFIDPKQWELAYLQKPALTTLPPDGSGKKGYADAVAILKCLNPLGQISLYSNS